MPAVVAVDWSGARPAKGIWLAVVRDGEIVESRPVKTREEAIADVAQMPSPVVAGFDFSFGVPAWFADERGCTSVEDVWANAREHGEVWLKPTPPFWRDKGTQPPPEKRFRRCEERVRPAKSVFQCVGNGQVGPGSVRGMPLLPELRAAGFAIWPFDAASDRMVVEIYPSALRRFSARTFAPGDQGDAECSALVMWAHRASFASLPDATGPVTRLEGDVWLPATASP